jgi:hypothetical protein
VHVFAARGLGVKHVDAAELRVVVAAVLDAAADAALIALVLICKISSEEKAWRRGERERKRAGRSGDT